MVYLLYLLYLYEGGLRPFCIKGVKGCLQESSVLGEEVQSGHWSRKYQVDIQFLLLKQSIICQIVDNLVDNLSKNAKSQQS